MMTLGELARAPAWPLPQVLALPGTMKAALLRDWGVHVNRRYGPGEADLLRAALGVTHHQLPDSPDPEARMPVGWQLALTRLIAERHLQGDLLALEPLLIEDARRRPVSLVERVARLAISPKKILAQSEKIHRNLFDVGQCRVELDKHRVTLTWTGSPLFSEPTWRVLQAFAIRGMYTVLNAHPPAPQGEARPDGFRLHLVG